MFGTRHAVVVTHSRLRESGTVVEEAVEQLTQAGFEVSIIDNIEAPDFGRQSPVVPERTEIVVAGMAPFFERPNWCTAPACRFLA